MADAFANQGKSRNEERPSPGKTAWKPESNEARRDDEANAAENFPDCALDGRHFAMFTSAVPGVFIFFESHDR